ncbi:OLC1v1038889C1 [Oldenlandia corymbosa var. corymbosa]|uniref:OLC1v1038889C1 n=1 Tax=Oldenlandia corymbosa var. corymbosa TaxID=529605 RepID=A0AAV1D1H0_OLDCO|nr:OLC1v1038889C1 [Oldenlandia corymbosa var. corymbosa]
MMKRRISFYVNLIYGLAFPTQESNLMMILRSFSIQLGHSHTLATISGDDIAMGQALLAEVEEKCYPGLRVEDTAKLMSEALKSCNGGNGLLSLATIIAGVDEEGRKVFLLDGKGKLRRGVRYGTGSGSAIAMVNMDRYRRLDTSVKRATKIAKRAICRAGDEARESGGFADGYHIRRYGWEKVFGDLPILDMVKARCNKIDDRPSPDL